MLSNTNIVLLVVLLTVLIVASQWLLEWRYHRGPPRPGRPVVVCITAIQSTLGEFVAKVRQRGRCFTFTCPACNQINKRCGVKTMPRHSVCARCGTRVLLTTSC